MVKLELKILELNLARDMRGYVKGFYRSFSSKRKIRGNGLAAKRSWGPVTRDICLMGAWSKDGARLFSAVPSDRTRGNGHKLKHRKIHLKISRNFFTLRVVKHLNSFPREVVKSPSLEIFKSCLDMILGNEL